MRMRMDFQQLRAQDDMELQRNSEIAESYQDTLSLSNNNDGDNSIAALMNRRNIFVVVCLGIILYLCNSLSIQDQIFVPNKLTSQAQAAVPKSSHEIQNQLFKDQNTQHLISLESHQPHSQQLSDEMTLEKEINQVVPLLKINQTVSQLQQTIKSMQYPKQRPKVIRNVKKSLSKQDEVYFAYSLSKNPHNQQYLEAQFYYYDKKYKIGSSMEQVPICVVAVGRNLGLGYLRMLGSVLRQNYSNYHVVFVDDNSNDGTNQKMEQFLKSNQQISAKVKYTHQKQRKYALFNRNQGIKEGCNLGDIIVDVDADDWLIGKQVFKIISALYQNADTWAIYFNNIIYSKQCHCPLMNADSQIPLEMLESNKYRVGKLWRTTELRTYRNQLYSKIDESDFVDKKGNYFIEKSDSFMNFAIVQLAGPKHVQFYDEFLYFYDSTFSPPSDIKAFCRLSAKIQTPYLPLQSLQSSAKKEQNYVAPEQYVNDYNKQIEKMGF